MPYTYFLLDTMAKGGLLKWLYPILLSMMLPGMAAGTIGLPAFLCVGDGMFGRSGGDDMVGQTKNN